MANKKFTQETIQELGSLEVVTYISESQINFNLDFKLMIATSKSIVEAKAVLENNGIDISLLGEKRFSSLYHRYKYQYKNLGAAAFQTETRGRKKISEKKTYDTADAETKLRMLEARNAQLEEEVDLLKKFTPFLPKQCKKVNKFQAINKFLGLHTFPNMNKTQSLKLLCEYLEVSSAGYYKYLKRITTITAKDIEDELIKEVIVKIQTKSFRKMKDSKGNKNKYKFIGYRQLTMQINNHEELKFRVNGKRVYRLAKELGMQSEYRQKNPYQTSDKPNVDGTHKSFDNILDRNFENTLPYNVLCTDITYFICKGFKAYLSAVIDATTKKIVAYKVSDSLKIDFVVDTINDIDVDMLNDETLMQSDQGSHYTSPVFSALLQELRITQSMSRKGKCLDNAPIESFFGHMKGELAYEQYDNLEDLQKVVDEYMIYYNYERPIYEKNKMTPQQIEDTILSNN